MLLGGLNVIVVLSIVMTLANWCPYVFSHSDDHQILKWDFQSGEATQARLTPWYTFQGLPHLRDCSLSISRLSSFLRRRMQQTFTGFLPVSAQRRHQTSLTFLYWHALTVSLQLWGSCDLYERSCDLYDKSYNLHEVMWLVWEIMWLVWLYPDSMTTFVYRRATSLLLPDSYVMFLAQFQ